MNILLTTFFFEGSSFLPFYDHMCRWLLDNISSEKINVKFLITNNFYQDAIDNFHIQKYNPILFSDEDFEYVFGSIDTSLTDITHKIILNNLSEKEKNNLLNILKEKLGNWTPDVIISQAHISGKNIFESIFPSALCLSTENAIFSRPPFLRTLSYDPYNSIPYNFPVLFSDKIKSFKITEEQNLKIEKFKKIITGVIDKYNELDDEIIFYYRQKFDKLVLLPLVGNKFITLFKDCIYETEFKLVEQIMESIPKNVGVFVTQADSYASLTSECIKYFSNKYPNFIYLKKTDKRGYASNSLNYFKHIDALINITSKTAFMAMLWDKPILSLSKQYNNWFKDSQGIENLEKVLTDKYESKNNILYWYFTRYTIFEQDFSKGNFLYNYLETKIEKYKKNGIEFDFFEEINSIDKVFDYVVRPVIEYYENTKPKALLKDEVAKTKVKIDESIDNYVRQNDKNIVELYKRTDELYSRTDELYNRTAELYSRTDELYNRTTDLYGITDESSKKLTYLIQKPSFIEQIFSIKNQGQHKILRILGIKIKFKRNIQ